MLNSIPTHSATASLTATRHLPGNRVVGSGPEKVIVMHNWMATLESYAGIWPFLDGDYFHYAFMDHRGYGMSQTATGTYTVKEAVADVLSLADHLGWERFHVIGHSMSGMIAQRLSVTVPTRLKSMVIVTPVPASGVPLDAAEMAMFESALQDDASWTAISQMLTSSRLSERWHRWKLGQFRAHVSPKAAGGYLRMWAKSDFHEDVIGNRVPCLVIAGQYDIPAFSPEAYRETVLAWYPNAKLVTFTESGHHPMEEEPVRFVTEIERFLRLYSG